jgi:hypothetical protein
MAIAANSPEKLHARNRGMLKMSKEQLHEFAATPRKGLPEAAEEGGYRGKIRKLVGR